MNQDKMNQEEILKVLQKIVNDILGDQAQPISVKTKRKDLNITSFAFVQMIESIEDAFDIEISNSQIRSAKTVEDIVSLIQKEVSKKS